MNISNFRNSKSVFHMSKSILEYGNHFNRKSESESMSELISECCISVYIILIVSPSPSPCPSLIRVLYKCIYHIKPCPSLCRGSYQSV